MRQFLMKHMSWESLKADTIQIYMAEFTEKELDELNRKIMQLEIEREAIRREKDKEKESLLTKAAEKNWSLFFEHDPVVADRHRGGPLDPDPRRRERRRHGFL